MIINAYDATAQLQKRSSEFDVSLIIEFQAMSQNLTDTPPNH